jgi:hypothetical protein
MQHLGINAPAAHPLGSGLGCPPAACYPPVHTPSPWRPFLQPRVIPEPPPMPEFHSPQHSFPYPSMVEDTETFLTL